MATRVIGVRLAPEVLEALERRLKVVAPSTGVTEAMRGFVYTFLCMDEGAARQAIRDSRRAALQFREQLEAEVTRVDEEPDEKWQTAEDFAAHTDLEAALRQKREDEGGSGAPEPAADEQAPEGEQ